MSHAAWSIATAAALILAASNSTAQQAMTPLRDSVVTAGNVPPVPIFGDSESRLSYLRWLDAMSDRLAPRMPDLQTRKELLQTTWYESRRAGLDVALVLGTMDVLSGFRKYQLAPNGAVGFMSVNPTWSATIGDGDVSKLMHMQTNLRFGCVVLRHYLDGAGGDVHAALRKYVGNNLGLADSNPIILATVNKIYDAAGRWAWTDKPQREGSPRKR